MTMLIPNLPKQIPHNTILLRRSLGKHPPAVSNVLPQRPHALEFSNLAARAVVINQV